MFAQAASFFTTACPIRTVSRRPGVVIKMTEEFECPTSSCVDLLKSQLWQRPEDLQSTGKYRALPRSKKDTD